jgi:hypothetical protein
MRLYLELPSWASWLHRPLDLLALPLLYLVILPFTAAYHILLSLLYGIPHEWDLRHYLYLNLRRVGSQYGSYRRLPPVDPEEDVLPARAEMYLPKCEYMRVTCPPMSKEVPRVGVLQTARAVVQDKDVTGFMIRRRGVSGVSAGRVHRLRTSCGYHVRSRSCLGRFDHSSQAAKHMFEARASTCRADPGSS